MISTRPSGIDKDFARERLSKHFVYESYDEESSLFLIELQ